MRKNVQALSGCLYLLVGRELRFGKSSKISTETKTCKTTRQIQNAEHFAVAAATVAASALPRAGRGQQTAPADAITMAEQLCKGDITPLEALDATIARVEALPKLNAVVIKNYELRRVSWHASSLRSAVRERLEGLRDSAAVGHALCAQGPGCQHGGHHFQRLRLFQGCGGPARLHRGVAPQGGWSEYFWQDRCT